MVLHVTHAPPAPTATVTAAPSQIQIGAASTLQWTTSGATAVSLSPGIGAVATTGTLTVTHPRRPCIPLPRRVLEALPLPQFR
jgi:hypothetical protein